jgi:hypothetical protein
VVACEGVSKTVTVTNTVNGKKLPIYFVETEDSRWIVVCSLWGEFITKNSGNLDLEKPKI